MKKLIDLGQQEAVLARMRGSTAMVCLFHSSRKRMAICLSKDGNQELIYIVAIGCERIAGPFTWVCANLAVSTEPPNKWGEIVRRIVDKSAGFELVCSDVVLFSSSQGVCIDPFDNFLGDALPDV